MKIVADDKIPFLRGVFEPYADIEYISGASISANDLLDCDALITRTRTICNEQLLANSSIKFIFTATIGTDHIDKVYLKSRQIDFASAIGCNANSVNQYITSSLLNLGAKYNIDLKGKTLGVIGVGNVGKKVVETAKILGLNVLENDPPRAKFEGEKNFVSLDYLLKNADFITIHTPFDETTRHLANLDFFKKSKSNAFFINSARGGICDNQALKFALKNRLIQGAILDVWEHEPHIDLELLELVDYGTMHIAGYSANGKANGTTLAVRGIADYFEINELKNFELPEFKLCENSRINLENIKNPLLFAVNNSYDIEIDSQNLKQNPKKFEFFRNEYHYRLEFPYFSVYNTKDVREQDISSLNKLGFKIEK